MVTEASLRNCLRFMVDSMLRIVYWTPISRKNARDEMRRYAAVESQFDFHSLSGMSRTCHAEQAPNDPAERESEGASKHPEDVSLTILFQGVPSKLFPLKSLCFPGEEREAASAEFPDAALAKGCILGMVWRFNSVCLEHASSERKSAGAVPECNCPSFPPH